MSRGETDFHLNADFFTARALVTGTDYEGSSRWRALMDDIGNFEDVIWNPMLKKFRKRSEALIARRGNRSFSGSSAGDGADYSPAKRKCVRTDASYKADDEQAKPADTGSRQTAGRDETHTASASPTEDPAGSAWNPCNFVNKLFS